MMNLIPILFYPFDVQGREPYLYDFFEHLLFLLLLLLLSLYFCYPANYSLSTPPGAGDHRQHLHAEPGRRVVGETPAARGGGAADGEEGPPV